MIGNAYNKSCIVVVFVTALYKHRSVIKHAIDKPKMSPGPNIEQAHPASVTSYNAFNSLLSSEQTSKVPTPDNEILL